jgi:heat shock protein HslJ
MRYRGPSLIAKIFAGVVWLAPVTLAATYQQQDQGARLFAENCAACHGTFGEGGSGPDLTNILWQWTSVTNRPTGETTEVPDPQDYTITFRDDGTLNGQADCNTFTGTYSQADGFSITLGAVTTAACGDGSLDQQYLELLGAVAAGGPDGTGNLALETAGGEQRMLFANGGAAPAP